MIERRLVGRRFCDWHPDAPLPLCSCKNDRRQSRRRTQDRDGLPGAIDLRWPGRRRPPQLLYSAVLNCRFCGNELSRVRNLSPEARRWFLADSSFGDAPEKRCNCSGSQKSDAHLAVGGWVMQAGLEVNEIE